MAETMSVRVGEDLLRALSKLEKQWQIDRSEVLRRLLVKALQEWKVENALERLKEKKISIGRAAKEAEISLAEMLDLVRDRKIDWVGYSDEDLKRDLEILG